MMPMSIFLVFLAGIAVPAGLFFYHFTPVAITETSVQWLLGILVVIPVMMSLIGAVLMALHSKSYFYVPLPDFPSDNEVFSKEKKQDQQFIMSKSQYSAQDVERVQAPESALERLVRGSVQAVCQDISAGLIHEALVYHTNVYTQLSALTHATQQFLQSGWTTSFSFRATEPHAIRVVQELSEDEFIAECEGAFDCTANYGTIQHSVPLTAEQLGQASLQPHYYPPLIGMPGVMRLRFRRFPNSENWLITGIYDSVRGLQIGDPTV